MTSLGNALARGFGGLAIWNEGLTRLGVRTRVWGSGSRQISRHITKDKCKQLHCQ